MRWSDVKKDGLGPAQINMVTNDVIKYSLIEDCHIFGGAEPNVRGLGGGGVSHLGSKHSLLNTRVPRPSSVGLF